VVKARSTPCLVCEPALTCRRLGPEARAREKKYVTLSTTGVLNFALDARCRLTSAQGFIGDLAYVETIL
jgi:hypothetical protein